MAVAALGGQGLDPPASRLLACRRHGRSLSPDQRRVSVGSPARSTPREPPRQQVRCVESSLSRAVKCLVRSYVCSFVGHGLPQAACSTGAHKARAAGTFAGRTIRKGRNARADCRQPRAPAGLAIAQVHRGMGRLVGDWLLTEGAGSSGDDCLLVLGGWPRDIRGWEDLFRRLVAD